MFDLRLLIPPYRRVTWGIDGVPPLGAVVVAEANSVRQLTHELAPLLARAPWCAPCVLVSAATADPAVLGALHDLPGRPAFVADPGSDEQLPAVAVAAVRDRPAPTASELADYVSRRTGWAELRPLLAGLLAAAAEDVPRRTVPARTLRDRLQRFGPFGPRGWRTVGTLCRIAATLSGGGVDVLAWRAGVGPRSLRAWARRYLGIAVQDLRVHVGWEWVLEAALRRGGYVDPGLGTAPRGTALPRGAAWGQLGRGGDRRPLVPSGGGPGGDAR